MQPKLPTKAVRVFCCSYPMTLSESCAERLAQSARPEPFDMPSLDWQAKKTKYQAKVTSVSPSLPHVHQRVEELRNVTNWRSGGAVQVLQPRNVGKTVMLRLSTSQRHILSGIGVTKERPWKAPARSTCMPCHAVPYHAVPCHASESNFRVRAADTKATS